MLVSERMENPVFTQENDNKLGKTTLVSRIVDHLRSQTMARKTPLLFFYFKHHEETKKSMGGMLRALLVQLLYQDESLIEYFYQKCCSTSTSELRAISVLKELAQESLKSQHHCLIALDGLDECESAPNTTKYEELREIIEWFQNSVIPNCHAEGGCIRLLLAGQRDGVLDQHLSASPGIKLDTIDAHLRDISGYTISRASKIRGRFSLSHENEDDIINKVTAAAKGQYGLLTYFKTHCNAEFTHTILQGCSSMLRWCWTISWTKVQKLSSKMN